MGYWLVCVFPGPCWKYSEYIEVFYQEDGATLYEVANHYRDRSTVTLPTHSSSGTGPATSRATATR